MKITKKICIIIPWEYPVPAVLGGAVETLVEYLMNENEKNGIYDLTILTTNLNNILLYNQKYKYSKIIAFSKKKYDKIWDIAFRGLKKYFGLLIPCSYRFIQILKYLKVHKEFDYILFEAGYTEMAYFLQKVYPKEKIIMHLHWAADGKQKIDKSFGYLISVSNYVGYKWNKSTDRKNNEMVVLKNCVDLSLFSNSVDENNKHNLRQCMNIEKDKFVILFIGRIIEIKGIKELIKAIQLLDNKNITLILIGSSKFGTASMTKYEKEVNDLIKKSGIDIIQPGYVKHNQLQKYCNIADIAVCPSIGEEAAGLVGIEYMASGLPIVASKLGGIPEYLGDECCLLVGYDKDYIVNLSNAIKILMNDLDLRKKMSSIAVEKAKQYDKTIYYENFVGIIENIDKKR